MDSISSTIDLFYSRLQVAEVLLISIQKEPLAYVRHSKATVRKQPRGLWEDRLSEHWSGGAGFE